MKDPGPCWNYLATTRPLAFVNEDFVAVAMPEGASVAKACCYIADGVGGQRTAARWRSTPWCTADYFSTAHPSVMFYFIRSAASPKVVPALNP